jgi:carbamate kinase
VRFRMPKCGFGPMETGSGFGSLLGMRILIALNDGDIESAAEALAEIAAEHQVVVAYDGGEGGSQKLELALRNALPDRDVVTVLSQVVVSPDDPALVRPSGVPSPNPSAITELRGVRTLIDAGAVVICASGAGPPVVIDREGTMREIEAVVDRDLTAALLARRLDADLFLALTDDGSDTTGAREEAVRRFVDATGRRAAIGTVADAGQQVRGAARDERVTLAK